MSGMASISFCAVSATARVARSLVAKNYNQGVPRAVKRSSSVQTLRPGQSNFCGDLAFGSRVYSSRVRLSAQTRASSSSSSITSGSSSENSSSGSSNNGKSGEQDFDFDLFTLGAGSGGTRASRMSASNHGAKVAICELPFGFVSSDSVGGAGGTCVLRGCVPKKLMVYAAAFPKEIKESRGFGWDSKDGEIDWSMFMGKKKDELRRLNGVYDKMLKNAGVKIIEGRGKLLDAHTVEVDGKKYTAKNILIAVGGRAVKPPIEGAELAMTSDEILEIEEIPKKLIVVGAGYIALEFACIFNNLGSQVDVMVRGEGVLRGFDAEICEFVLEQYQKNGITFHFGTSPTKIEKIDSGFSVSAEKKTRDGGKEEVSYVADQILLATGRKPNTKNLGLEDVGVEMGKGGSIKVDEYSRTTVPSVYAVGDVTDRLNLTPVALMEGTAFAKNVFGDAKDAKPVYDNIASAVFTTPQIATCGLTEEEAVQQYGDLVIFTSTYRGMRATISGDEGKGFIKLIVAKDSDLLVGVHLVGSEVGEIMQGLSVAMKMGVTKKQLDSTVGIHPSSAEEIVTMRDSTREVSAADWQAAHDRQEAGESLRK